MFKNKSILVTGGTGSFGKKFIESILINHKEVRKLNVFSRDELKQFEMAQVFSQKNIPVSDTLLEMFETDIVYRERARMLI